MRRCRYTPIKYQVDEGQRSTRFALHERVRKPVVTLASGPTQATRQTTTSMDPESPEARRPIVKGSRGAYGSKASEIRHPQ